MYSGANVSYLASDHLCIRASYGSKSCTWCKCNVFISRYKKSLDFKQMQLCLNQEIIWPWNLHKTGHASLIHPGAACIDYHTNRSGRTSKVFFSLRQLKLTPAYHIGPARTYLVYFTQSWRSLSSMFVFGTIEDTPNIIRTRYIFKLHEQKRLLIKCCITGLWVNGLCIKSQDSSYRTGLTGTHQNLVGLTIFKSGESRDSPFQNPTENPA